MNLREKVLAVVVSLIVGFAGARWLVWDGIVEPREAKQAQIESLAEQVDEKRKKVTDSIQQANDDLARWRKDSATFCGLG